MHRFSFALQDNKHLKVLNLGLNRLGDAGVELICNAVALNTALEFLDLFDVDFSNVGA